MDLMLQHLKETQIQQHAVTQEQTQSLRITTEELLALKGLNTITTTPLPNPCPDTQHMLSQLNPEEDVKAYLLAFEHVAQWEGWAEDVVAHPHSPCLWENTKILLLPLTCQGLRLYHPKK